MVCRALKVCVIFSVWFGMSGCGLNPEGGSGQARGELRTPEHAHQWLREQAQLSKSEQIERAKVVLDLLTVVNPVGDQVVFRAPNPIAAKSARGSADTVGSHVSVASRLAGGEEGAQGGLSSTQEAHAVPLVDAEQGVHPEAVAVDLMQARLPQMQYLGRLNYGHEVYGLIKVGGRVYRVVPGQSIGLGRWVVQSIEQRVLSVWVDGRRVSLMQP